MPDVPFAEHGFGLFGPDFGVPKGGFCLSTFLVLEHEGGILAGRMARESKPVWTRRWAPNIAYYEGDRHEELFQGWRLPASYVRTGEHPRQAVQRVLVEQLELDGSIELNDHRIVSGASPSRRAPDAQHWDVLFLYRAQGPPISESPPEHWRTLSYRDRGALADEELVMRHEELLDML